MHMIVISSFCLMVYQDIIKIDNYKLPSKWFQYLIHKSHECTRSI